MANQYSKYIVSAEQFTDDFTPNGVCDAPVEFIEKVLVPSMIKEVKSAGAFIYKLPKPDESDYEISALFKTPYPFNWIHKGDYVVINSSGYGRVVSKIEFEREYKEIKII